MNRVTKQTGSNVLNVPQGTIEAVKNGWKEYGDNLGVSLVSGTNEAWKHVYEQSCRDWMEKQENKGRTVWGYTYIPFCVSEQGVQLNGVMNYWEDEKAFAIQP